MLFCFIFYVASRNYPIFSLAVFRSLTGCCVSGMRETRGTKFCGGGQGELKLNGDICAECNRAAALYEAVGHRQVLGIHGLEVERLIMLIQQIFSP